MTWISIADCGVAGYAYGAHTFSMPNASNFPRIIVGLVLLSGTSAVVRADETLDEAVRVGTELAETCEMHGVHTCDVFFRGYDVMFDLLLFYGGRSWVEEKFERFVAKRYPQEAFDFDLFNASREIRPDLKFSPSGLIRSVKKAERTRDGFLLTLESGEQLELIKAGGWFSQATPETTRKREQMRPWLVAEQTRQSILRYRMLEAEMAGLDKGTLEDKLNLDLAPLIAKFLGAAKVPVLLRVRMRSLEEVVEFYGQFKSVKDMERKIRADLRQKN